MIDYDHACPVGEHDGNDTARTTTTTLQMDNLKPGTGIRDGMHSDASSMTGEVLPLFDEDHTSRTAVRHMFRSMSIYNPTIPGSSQAEKKQSKVVAQAKLGTFMGVYLPCIQNIFGVLLFIRLAWIVGTAGTVQAFFIVLICCTVSFLTTISLSAIATNGIVPAGGPYYMISRNLGPEIGGAVGVLFYLGTTVASSMYIIGAVEIFMYYLVPAAKIFEDDLMCFRLYGTILLMLLACVVLAGVRVVSKFALPTIGVVVICVACMFIGGAVKYNGSDQFQFCMVGGRLANMKAWQDAGNQPVNCSYKELQPMFCSNSSNGEQKCDTYFEEQGLAGQIYPRTAIKGVGSGVFMDNIDAKYLSKGDLLSRNFTDDPLNIDVDVDKDKLHPAYVFADLSTGFMVLIGVFFPSVTGIMAGSNRSGDLKDASKSIPQGTLSATLTASVVYLLSVMLFGAAINEMFIRDKFGDSAYGKLVVAELAIPHPVVILIGCFMSTVGAGMQSLTGAPRLLQAIAKDGVIPVFAPFQKATAGGEPLRAILLTLFISEIGILIAQLESVTALITQFFLMCYCSVNAACALQSILKSPGWRPRFKYYHWSLSFVGAVMCVAVMFVSHWGFALFAIVVGAIVYKYVEFRGAEKEWGDGLRGLGLAAARYSLLNLEDRPQHTKNWRPQVLTVCASDPEAETDVHEHLMSFVSQLKAGRGLTVLTSVIQGEFSEKKHQADAVRTFLKLSLKRHRIKGFCDVCVTHDRAEGIACSIQTSGLGAMRHNTVLAAWPTTWRNDDRTAWQEVHAFVDTIRTASIANCAILMPKHVQNFPMSNEKVKGTLDVWWVVHDGGMLMLLPFLLQQHRTWAQSKLRIFTVAQLEDNSLKMKEDLRTFLHQLRIVAEVDVIEMSDSDISEYTYERTLRMEQRVQLVHDLHLRNKDAMHDPQMAVMDSQIQQRKLSKIGEELELDVRANPSPHSTELTDIQENAELSIDTNNADTVHSQRSIDDVSDIASPISPNTNGPASYGRRFESKPPPTARNSLSKSQNIRRMHTAVKLNEVMKTRSQEASLIIANLPGPPRHRNEQYYMEFIEALTDGLDRVLLVKGTGSEVVTIYA